MFFNDIHTRIRYIFLLLTIMLVIIIIRVFYVQVFQYKKLNDLASDLWSRNLPIKADRGLILDRNGIVLANNITTTSLVLIPNQIKDKETTAKSLANILGVSYEEMYKHVSKKTSIERVHPEGRQLSYDIAKKIDDLNYDGVYLLKESKRNYPYETVLSHVLGYVGIDNQGLSGIELQYDEYLNGTDGAIKYFSDGHGNRLKLAEVYVSPTSGLDIKLTIDINIQLALESELDNAISKYNPEHALIIVADPTTGEILGMASRPNFNSNNYKNYSIETINRNLPIWMTYEPGSTFKILTLSASIEEKTINLFEDIFHDSGSVTVEGARIKCWKAGGHGTQTYLEVVENSCNPGFVNMGLKLGTKKLMEYVKKFGFGNKTGIDLNGEGSGILFKEGTMGLVETATVAFGQGISVTPIQQVVAVSASINGGTLYSPYVVKGIVDNETELEIKTFHSKKVRTVISEETSSLVRHALESVVANGTGRNAYIENYRVGGKTGTAQKVKNGAYMVGNYILSFIGFLPADNPKAIVYVGIDNPKGVVQYGGTVSAPIAKSVMLSVINALKIEPSKEGMAKEYMWLDTKYVLIPNVVGKSLNDVKKELKGYNVIYSGNGNTVKYQSPEGGYYGKEGSTINLLLTD